MRVLERDVGDGVETISLEVRGKAPNDRDDGERAEVFVAIVEDGLVSEVTRGENTGRRLREEAVVRQLVPLGALSSDRRVQKSFGARLKREWNRSRLRYVAWIQSRDSRAVIAVAQIPQPAG